MKILEITNVDFALKQFLLPLMDALRAKGHDVQGVCADGPAVEEVRAYGFTVHTLPLSRSLSPLVQIRAFWALYCLIRREKPDSVHAHMPISGILARFAAKLCGVRFIAYTGHGFLFNQPGPLARKIFSLVLEFLAGRVTNRYMTVSQEEAEDARRLYFHPSPVAVANGRDPERYYPNETARQYVRQALNVPEARSVIVIVSRLVRHKGYPELLRAMEEVPDAELWVVGERLPSDHGCSLMEVFERAEHRLGGRLRLLGLRDDIADILAAADIFVLPSHFEGLPMSVIEAMLCGLPVVTTRIRGPREQVLDKVTGLLVPPGLTAPLARALRLLVQDRALAREMGRKGRERACALYDEKRVLERIVALLTQQGE